LVAINGEPCMAHQVRLLHANSVECVVICAGYLGEQ
jgi:CTP:phosphocholine cytidylyltransferase-like protein